jgi:hypothetical protein
MRTRAHVAVAPFDRMDLTSTIGEESNPMDARDEQDAAAPADTEPEPTLITATGLGVDGEHAPLFSDIDLALTSGFHAIQMPGGPGQTALLLTLLDCGVR